MSQFDKGGNAGYRIRLSGGEQRTEEHRKAAIDFKIAKVPVA
jgi:hypothetical protein